MTRREFSIDFFNFVFMAFFFAALFVAPFVCAWHYMDRAISAGNTAPRTQTTYPLAVLGEPGASVPTATNREAGAVPQADRATPCCAIPSPVSTGSERSDLRVILPTSGAVQVGGSHVVRRVPGPAVSVSWLSEAAQGLAQRPLTPFGMEATPSRAGSSGGWTFTSEGGAHGPGRVLGPATAPVLALSSSRIRGEASTVRAQGNLPEGSPVRSGWADQKRDGVEPEVHAIASTRGVSGGAPLRASGLYEVTAYSHGCTMPRSGRERPAQRGADGRWPVAELTVAADTSLHPFGTEVLIEGLGFRRVGDRGHAIKGRRLDLFLDSCEAAREFGRRWLSVTVVPVETTRWAAR